jgi:hypothetical protein
MLDASLDGVGKLVPYVAVGEKDDELDVEQDQGHDQAGRVGQPMLSQHDNLYYLLIEGLWHPWVTWLSIAHFQLFYY